MIMEVRYDGITVVKVKNKEEELLLGVAIISILESIPTLSMLVGGVMAGQINLEDLGIVADTAKITKEEELEPAIASLKGKRAADDSDIPDFVKRSLDV